MKLHKGRRGTVGCKSDSLCGGHVFETKQRPRCFLEKDAFTLIALHWLVSGTDSSVISQSN